MGLEQIWANHTIAFDVELELVDKSELGATQYIFDYFGHLTTGVAMVNPGWKQDGVGLDHYLDRYQNIYFLPFL